MQRISVSWFCRGQLGELEGWGQGHAAGAVEDLVALF